MRDEFVGRGLRAEEGEEVTRTRLRQPPQSERSHACRVRRRPVCSYALGRRRSSKEFSTPDEPGEATTNLRCFAVVRNVLTDVGKIRSHSFPQSNVRLCNGTVSRSACCHRLQPPRPRHDRQVATRAGKH